MNYFSLLISIFIRNHPRYTCISIFFNEKLNTITKSCLSFICFGGHTILALASREMVSTFLQVSFLEMFIDCIRKINLLSFTVFWPLFYSLTLIKWGKKCHTVVTIPTTEKKTELEIKNWSQYFYNPS